MVPLNRRISHVKWGAPEDWVVWNAGEGPERANALAATMHDDPHMIHAIAEGIRALDADAPGSHPGTTSMGVWLPESGARDLAATVLVRVLEADSGGRLAQGELLDWAGRPGRVKGVKVLGVDTSPGEVEAGPAVLQVLETASRWSRKINVRMNWFILPPGTEQIVLCQFDTSYPSMVDALGWETNAITDSLSVLLEEDA